MSLNIILTEDINLIYCSLPKTKRAALLEFALPLLLLKLKTPAFTPLLQLPPRLNHGLLEETKLALQFNPYINVYTFIPKLYPSLNNLPRARFAKKEANRAHLHFVFFCYLFIFSYCHSLRFKRACRYAPIPRTRRVASLVSPIPPVLLKQKTPALTPLQQQPPRSNHGEIEIMNLA